MADGVGGFRTMGVDELARRLHDRAATLVLDVRHREAWSVEGVTIPGAVWVPLDEVPERVRDLPRDVPLVVFCS